MKNRITEVHFDGGAFGEGAFWLKRFLVEAHFGAGVFRQRRFLVEVYFGGTIF